MGCSHPKEIVKSFNIDYTSLTDSKTILKQDNVINLKKGGIIVQTKIGNIQFGMPPETVKDSLNAGLTVPSIYIIPGNRFDKDKTVSAAEFEFPAYFNFFVLRKTIRLICDEETEAAIRMIFQETLQGPKDLSKFKEDFTHDYPESLMPDMEAEQKHFGVNPFTKEPLAFESIITIVLFDAKGVAVLEDGVSVERKNGIITIKDDDTDVAKFVDKVSIKGKEYEAFLTFTREHDQILTEDLKPGNNEDIICPQNINIQDRPLNWIPPDFGVTFLGTGHGFDVKDATSGHIVWINGRGVMVDPPPFSGDALKYYGVSPNLIDKVIVTHVHADHDAGTLQKLLSGYRLELIATPTIMGSFIRKYSAITSMTQKELQKMFEFRPVTIGYPLEVYGAKFRFFYSLHVIPCLGYECEFNGKKIYFSGDTFYDPKGLAELNAKGVLREQRYQTLANPDWSKYDVILHEAGVPPIHTPISNLQLLPDNIRPRISLYHVASKDIPKDSDIKKSVPGFDHSIIILPKTDGDLKSRNLELICNIPLFKDMPLRRIGDLLNCFKLMRYGENELIFKKGTIGHDFQIVKSGIIRIFDTKVNEIQFEKFYFQGDYFGEAAISNKKKRQANVVAHTECQLLSLSEYDFKWFFGPQSTATFDVNTNVMDFATSMYDKRRSPYAEFINNNKFVCKLTQQQKDDINVCLKEYRPKDNEVQWKKDDIQCTFCFFICSGEFMLIGAEKAPGYELKKGQLVGDFPSLLYDKQAISTVKCKTSGMIQQLEKIAFLDFVSKSPGSFMVLKDKLAVD